MDERRIAIGNDKVGSLLAPKSPVRGNLGELRRPMRQQQREQSFLIFASQVFWTDSSEQPQFVFFVARKVIGLRRGNKRHVPVGSAQARREAFQLRTKLRQCQSPPLQFDIGVHVGD